MHRTMGWPASSRMLPMLLLLLLLPAMAMVLTGRAAVQGHGSLIGNYSKKIIAYAIRNSRCRKCVQKNVSSHTCFKNHSGSSKAMEADMVVDMVLKNDLLVKANCRIQTIIGDEDSSSIAALKRLSPYDIYKWSDFNHIHKTFNSKLYDLKINASLREYFSKAFALCIKLHKGDEKKVKSSLQNLIPHAFGDHSNCGSWCAKCDKNNHTYKYFKNGKCLTDNTLKTKLEKIMEPFIKNSSHIAPCAPSQINESFNYTVTTKHPKSIYYGGSGSHANRVALAVCQKNIGYDYINQLYSKWLVISPGKNTKNYREKKQQQRERQLQYKKLIPFKKRRLFLKKERARKNFKTTIQEGITYKSGVGYLDTSDVIDKTLLPRLSTIATEESQSQELAEFTSGCYFSAEYQGEFVMQVSSGNNVGYARGGASNLDDGEPIVQYSTLNITFNAIPVWGYCHKKIDDKVLLRDRRGGYSECIRCFQLMRRSRNIIEVYSKDLNSCYTNETIAIESCKYLNYTSILYRTSEVGGEKIRNEYCPIAGKYRFKYSVNYEYDALENNNAEIRDECGSFSSDFDNCPNGSQLRLQFKRCSFEEHDISFECLGSWPAAASSRQGTDTPRYVALMDSRGAPEFTGPMKRRRPYYRCGLYHVDSRTAKTYLTLSSDSSCMQDLYNSSSGYESFVLSKTTTQKKMPNYVINNLATFPQWAQGEWQETLIVNGTMTFNDLNSYRSFTFVTVDSNDDVGLYKVFSRDQCEQETYTCIVMKQRSENVLEFTVGSSVYQSHRCNSTSLLMNKSNTVWWTLARLERTVESPCPITGQYTGQITDLPGMCAELSSNCNTRQVMYYKVYDCNSGELYEERTYLCLGQWEEDGLTYTYTTRNDTGTNECFVGAIVNDDEIYIKEAGDYCIRNKNPRIEGMRLYKKGQCYGNSSSPAPTIPTETSMHVPTMRITTPIKAVTARAPITTKTRGVVRASSTTQRIPSIAKSSSGRIRENTVILSLNLAFLIISIVKLPFLRSVAFHA